VESPKPNRLTSEFSGFVRFLRESAHALVLALIFIVYVVQAFRIPSGSMEDSLLIGDQLLALKFIYGAPVLPFTYWKFPGIKNPTPGDVVIFRCPNKSNKDFIKRCVAGPGQTVEVRAGTLTVNGTVQTLAPHGKLVRGGRHPMPDVEHFAPLRIPARGDTIRADGLPVREMLFFKHLVHQEYPYARVGLNVQLYVDSTYANSMPIVSTQGSFTLDEVNRQGMVDQIDDWTMLARTVAEIEQACRTALPGRTIQVKPVVLLDNKPVYTYVVKNDNYFMMGDNRDNSLDSRFWGYVNRNHIKAQALIVYMSFDSETPWILLPLKIRWNRLGKLIRSWHVPG
jgi:signal peptidase I